MSLTTDMQLFKLADRHGIKLNGIGFKDQFETMILRPGGYIINMACSSNDGTHWVALWIDKKNVTYFDSFGVYPPMEIRKALKKTFKRVLVSDKHIQNINSGWCGIYNLFFIWYMQNASGNNEQKLNSFHNIFSEIPEDNLRILKKNFISNVH